MKSAPQPTAFNPFEPGFFDDPYVHYRRVRETQPVNRSPLGNWSLFRYADIAPFVSDPRHSVQISKATPTPAMEMMRAMAGDREWRRERSMLNLDAPTHTRLRKLVQKAFTPRTVQGLRGRIQALVDEALDAVDGTMDVIADLAFPLPFTVISEMLGIPAGHDRWQLREWSGSLVKTLDPILTQDEVDAAFAAGERMDAFLHEVVAHRRAHPADDMLTALIHAEEEGDVLNDQELVDQVALLYIAGHETTVNLIGNGTLALLRHRDQLERLRDDPSLDANAVEELLRYDSPVQFTRRVLLTDVEVAGTPIEAGSFVALGLGSANRDPEHFGPQSDELDLGRPDAAQHLSFGGGIHYCLGAALARLEGQVAIGTLVRRFGRIELATDTLDWNGRINLRGLASLPVTLRAS